MMKEDVLINKTDKILNKSFNTDLFEKPNHNEEIIL
jgi:hypothetical protein